MAWTQNLSVGRQGDVVAVYSEEVVNDSDKILDVNSDVGDDGVLEVLGIRVEYAADATVGTRTLHIEMQDADDDIIFGMQLDAAADVTASATEVVEMLVGFGAPFVTGLTPASNGPHLAPLPRLILGENDKLRVFADGTTGAGDDMVVHVRALKR